MQNIKVNDNSNYSEGEFGLEESKKQGVKSDTFMIDLLSFCGVLTGTLMHRAMDRVVK
jgi:hypothetical protein